MHHIRSTDPTAVAGWRRALLLAGLLGAGAVGAQQAPPADTLRWGLADVLSRAQTEAHAIDIAASGIAEAQGMQRQARAGLWPSLSVSQQVVRSDDAVAAFGTRLRQERFTAADFDVARLNNPDAITDVRTVVEVQQPLFTSGRSLALRRAAAAGANAAQAGARRTRQTVRLQATEAYWGLVLATRALEVTESALDAARQHAADAAAALRHGAIPRADELAARLRVAEIEAQRIDATQRVATAVDGLTLLLDLPAGTVVVPVDALEAPQTPVDDDAGAGERADLTAQRLHSEAARQQARAERAALWPQVGAFAQVAVDADAPLAADGESWTAGAMLRWDLFSGFAGRGRADVARARARRAERQTELLAARVEREAREARRALIAARQRVEVAAAAVGHADENLRVTHVEFREGAVPVSALLDAEAAWRGARLRQLQALHDVQVGLARYAFAAGVDAPPTTPQP